MSFAYIASLGGTAAGPDIATEPFWSSGNVVYVATAGSDSTGDGSFDRPYRTLGQAYAGSSANAAYLIALMPGYTETFTSQVAVSNAGITVWGLGQGSQKPRLTCGFAGHIFNWSGAYGEIRNCYFPASTVAGATERVLTSAAGFHMADCDFIAGANESNTKYAVTSGGTGATFSGCTFTATSSAQYGGLLVSADGCTVEDCDFDGGSAGWYGVVGLHVNTSITARIKGGTFVNQSNIVFASGAHAMALGPSMGAGCYVLQS